MLLGRASSSAGGARNVGGTEDRVRATLYVRNQLLRAMILEEEERWRSDNSGCASGSGGGTGVLGTGLESVAHSLF